MLVRVSLSAANAGMQHAESIIAAVIRPMSFIPKLRFEHLFIFFLQCFSFLLCVTSRPRGIHSTVGFLYIAVFGKSRVIPPQPQNIVFYEYSIFLACRQCLSITFSEDNDIQLCSGYSQLQDNLHLSMEFEIKTESVKTMQIFSWLCTLMLLQRVACFPACFALSPRID